MVASLECSRWFQRGHRRTQDSRTAQIGGTGRLDFNGSLRKVECSEGLRNHIPSNGDGFVPVKHESSHKVRLLFITQELSYSSVNLSVAHTWVRELAQRAEALHVIASRVTDVDLPSNVSVHSLGQESDRTRWQRARKLAATVVSLVATRNVNAVMAHMVPAYALAVAPLARAVRIPVVLWYTSHGRSLSLTWANRLVNASVTASVESYPIPRNQAYVCLLYTYHSQRDRTSYRMTSSA